MVIEVNESNFENEVLESTVPVLVDFFSEHCGPCRMIKPALTLLAKELDGQAIIVAVDVAVNPSLVNKLHIHAVPTLLVFRDGKEVKRMVGLGSLSELREALQ
jgi:thioredoxin 1